MAEEEKTAKKIVVDQEVCIGCGGCVGVAPEHFKLNDEGKSEVIKQYDEADRELIEEAINACPVQAISLE